MSTTPSTTGTRSSALVPHRTVQSVCLLLGFAGALYYVSLSAGLSAVFGTGSLSDRVSLASTLLGVAGGLAMGLAARPEKLARTVLVVLAVLAGYAALGPWILQAIDTADLWMLGDQPAPPALGWQQIVMQCLAAALVLAPPAVMIAFALTILSKAACEESSHSAGSLPSQLMGLTGAGTGLGFVTVAFAVAPTLGDTAAHWIALVATVAVIGLVLRMRVVASAMAGPTTTAPGHTTVTASGRLQISRPSRAQFASRRSDAKKHPQVGRFWLLSCALAAGAGATAAHWLWFRLLALGVELDDRWMLVTPGLVAVSFALGCLVFNRLFALSVHARTALVGLHGVAAVVSLLLYFQFGLWLEATADGGFPLVAGLVVYALPAFVLGATLGLLDEITSADSALGKLAAVSTASTVAVGASLGAITAWLWILPAGGFESLVKLVMLCSIVVVGVSTQFVTGRGRILTGIVAALLAVIAIAVTPQQPDVTPNASGTGPTDITRPQRRAFVPGRGSTAGIIEHDGQFIYEVDGVARESIPVIGSAPTQNGNKWLATLPVTARPQAQTLLAIGLGGGLALEGVPPSISRIDVVEPESAIVEVNRSIASERGSNSLQDSRVTIIANNARRSLSLTTQRYDIIISDYSRPTTRLDNAYLTREFFAQLRAHLSDAGIFAQHIDDSAVDSNALRVIAATLRAEYPYVRLYRPERSSLIFVASLLPIEPELQLARFGAPITDDVMHYSRIGMNGVEDLLAALIADESGVERLAADAQPHADAARLGAINPTPGEIDAAISALAAADPLQQRGSWFYADLTDRVNFAYLARRLAASGQTARALAVAETQTDGSTRLMMIGILHDERDQPEQAAAAYRAAVDSRPDNAQARYLMLEPDIGRIAQSAAEDPLRALAAPLPPVATAVIEAWKFAATQEWAAVADLDGVLARASVTDVWFRDVVRLRADWRSRATENVAQLAFDALRLVDRAVLIRPDSSFYLLRAAIGIAIGDGNIAVESSRQIVRLVAQTLEDVANGDGLINRREVAIIQQNLNAIDMNLRGDLVADNERRAEEVRQRAGLILRYIEAAIDADSP